MSLLSFALDAGKKLLGLGDDAENIKKEIEENSSTMPIEGLDVKIDGDTIVLSGDADANTKAKAALIAGNVKGIKEVTFEGANPEDQYYEIKSGDNLSKVSKKFYGNSNHYNEIFEANREVIKDMNLIYPGQMIRIPKI